MISEEGPLYCLLSFDEEKVVNEILQGDYSAEAYDEQLEEYVERSMQDADELYEELRDAFSEEAESFLFAFKRIVETLEMAIEFVNKWGSEKINPQIDNTK